MLDHIDCESLETRRSYVRQDKACTRFHTIEHLPDIDLHPQGHALVTR